jgi:hypothetical protein
MTLARRELLARTGLALAAGAVASSSGATGAVAQGKSASPLTVGTLESWDAIRAQFALSDDFIHMSAMLISSHPKPVREAIDEHRGAWMPTRSPTSIRTIAACRKRHEPRQASISVSAGQTFALTDSTTMGVALVYNGLRLTPDHEILTTEQDYYVTREPSASSPSELARRSARSRSTSRSTASQRTRSSIVSLRRSHLRPECSRSPGCIPALA